MPIILGSLALAALLVLGSKPDRYYRIAAIGDLEKILEWFPNYSVEVEANGLYALKSNKPIAYGYRPTVMNHPSFRVINVEAL